MTTKRQLVSSVLAASAAAALSFTLTAPAAAANAHTTAPDNGTTVTQQEDRQLTPIDRRYWSDPELRRVLGPPVDSEQDLGEISYRQFENGWMYHTSSTGVHETHGAIADKYTEVGTHYTYGVPVTDELSTPDGVGRFNYFEGTDAIGTASIYWTRYTGAQGTWGPVQQFWGDHGWETGFLSYPTTTTADTPHKPGVFSHFLGADGSGASVYWSPDTGAHSVQGTIREEWAQLGWEDSWLGFPTSNEYDIPGGKRSDFQGGFITWNASTGIATAHRYSSE
ncbi:uncharacterized protein with LGFP repeats [Saccharopolyspora lacisalsi]|uniref:Uncharacterized protein with LGFP repeats n=1 Tax=Halosaccharopolyspora lacisalsi TaxID=1000566 RepID=A0A839E6H6_9PSEU|nr:hypothetical protein [Halosaccharopolyspora lacisalsi]MBA8827485.1 uncharacterized protein with LGFP repeats [Halosaccharopolyspora lacisalsi]